MSKRPPKEITSVRNETLLAAYALRESKERRKTKLFLVEGVREITQAIAAHFVPQQVFFCADALTGEEKKLMPALEQSCDEIYSLSEQALGKISQREHSGGLVVVCSCPKQWPRDPFARKTSEPLFLLALEGIEKPGNLGAVLRSAEAAGVHGVVILAGGEDFFHPHIVRNSLGAVFRVPIMKMSHEDFVQSCRAHRVKTVATYIDDTSIPYTDENFRQNVCVLFGAEATGLTPALVQECQSRVIIPMAGAMNSLNIAAAAAVLCFEVRRQRLSS